ncbi:MAG: hypothetical protein R3A10_04760 [Caldilineaceae bacterium]
MKVLLSLSLLVTVMVPLCASAIQRTMSDRGRCRPTPGYALVGPVEAVEDALLILR